ncbi:hypothetical protein EUTSA_v10020836mg [Eutrema salsugineum]|uniref:Uncharacterized protein n=1 Tax=Eutrema salsugineum TaxID=72664 RepID=V4M4P3_EUTSA|nr:hypothetical protein EUTSA_v10020836mg [Eutrema salsugineum]
MALLSACWLMIESIVIQDGFLKWSYMKLFMHPLLLFLCQLFIWLYLFFLWLVTPFQTFYNAFLSLLVTFSKLFSSFIRVIVVRREVTCNIEPRQEINNTLVNLELSRSIHNPVPTFSFSFKHQVDSQLKVLLAMQKGEILEDEEDFCCQFDQENADAQLLDGKVNEEDEDIVNVDVVNMEKNLELKHQTMPINQENIYSLAKDVEEEEEDTVNSNVETDLPSLVASDDMNSLYSDGDHPSPLFVASLDSAVQDSIDIENQTHQDEDDEVYKKYCERMKWYDILSRDRTYGLSVIMNQETASGLSLWGITAEKRLKQSIEKDLELVYVAQSCLSWEALQHQYITVKDSLKSADSGGGFYNDDISKEFQKFQVLLERFLEDERCEVKRVLSFVQRRFELMSFFQVPRISGN